MVPRSKGKNKDLAVQPNGRRVLKLIKDLGEGVRYGQPGGYRPARNIVPEILRDSD